MFGYERGAVLLILTVVFVSFHRPGVGSQEELQLESDSFPTPAVNFPGLWAFALKAQPCPVPNDFP